MSWHKKNLIAFFLLFILFSSICVTESRYRDQERERKKSSSSSSSSNRYKSSGNDASIQASILESPNLCSRERDQKLLCYCLPDNLVNNNLATTKADCWIFHKDLHANDSIWMAFHEQKSIRNLKFTVQPTGYLDYIPTKSIEQLTNLTMITIEYSQILVVKGYAFGNLENLDEITMTNNQIEIIDQNAFKNHILLKEINLENNQIIEIDRDAFQNLPQLKGLYLNQNNITNLHDETFKELTKLEDLDIGYNQISVLTGDMFKGLGNLNTLKLTHNAINFIGDTVFAELWSLQELELDSNQIERISERALDGLNNLKTLNLRNNLLKKLDNGLLRGTPALLSINLQDNVLETITYYNFQPIMDNLINRTSELLLSDNNFTCDCRLQWIYDLRNRTRNINLKNSLEEIECVLYDDKQTTSIQSNKKKSGLFLSNEFEMNLIKERTNLQRDLYSGNSNRHHRQYPQDNDFNGNKGIQEFDTDYNKFSDNIASGGGIRNNQHNNNMKTSGISNGKKYDYVVVLLTLRPETLPCPEEFSYPTELPLSRESIGLNVLASNSIYVRPNIFFVILINLSSFLFIGFIIKNNQ